MTRKDAFVFATRERNTVVTASAKVQVILEIDAGSRWGNDTLLAQIDTQAIDDVNHTLQRLETFAKSLGVGVRVVGQPTLVSVQVQSRPR